MRTVGSLFSGIGGIDLGLERAGFEIRWQVESDESCRRVLGRHWPFVARYGDVRYLDLAGLEHVDLVCGGFPCQSVSDAGTRLGADDERWLWPEFARVLRAIRPRLVLVENVPGLLIRGMGEVLGDLAALGYDAEWESIPAAAVGADHVRERVWIVADADRRGREVLGGTELFRVVRESRRFPDRRCAVWRFTDSTSLGAAWETESSVGRMVNGLPGRMERLESLGNAVVPQVAEWIGRRLITL